LLLGVFKDNGRLYAINWVAATQLVLHLRGVLVTCMTGVEIVRTALILAMSVFRGDGVLVQQIAV